MIDPRGEIQDQRTAGHENPTGWNPSQRLTSEQSSSSAGGSELPSSVLMASMGSGPGVFLRISWMASGAGSCCWSAVVSVGRTDTPWSRRDFRGGGTSLGARGVTLQAEEDTRWTAWPTRLVQPCSSALLRTFYATQYCHLLYLV